MFPSFRLKVVKRCAEGHRMDATWRSCPRCTGRTRPAEARDITERTVLVNPAGPTSPAAPSPAASSPAAPSPAAPSAVPAVPARLHVEEGPLTGRVFDVPAGRIKLGKSPREEAGATVLALEDPYMSRDHAALTAGTAAVVVNDLMSTNGTFVNGERVQRAILQDGDRIRLGRTTLRVAIAPRP